MSSAAKNTGTSTRRPPLGRAIAENVECLAIAIVMALILKFFLLEAYKIPTGSMQPTIMGLDEPGVKIFDRVLVNKTLYYLRDPERFEVVVFKMPLSQRQNYIKRLLGLPGETLRIRNGDVFHTPHGGAIETDESIARKPDSVWESVRRRVVPADPDDPRLERFVTAGGDASTLLELAARHLGTEVETLCSPSEDTTRQDLALRLLRDRSSLDDSAIAERMGLRASDLRRRRSREAPLGYTALLAAVDESLRISSDQLRLVAGSASACLQLSEDVKDSYYHGYGPDLLEALGVEDFEKERTNPVSDLEISGELQPDDEVRALRLQILGARFVHTAEFDLAADQVEISSVLRRPGAKGTDPESGPASSRHAASLPAGRSTEVSFRSVDDQLVLRVDDEEIARIPYRTEGLDPRNVLTNVTVACDGGELTIEDFTVHRDIFYTSPGSRGPEEEYVVPEDAFFMMGDNTQHSYDCRQWTLGVYELADGREISGNFLRSLRTDPDANPRVVSQSIRGTRLQFRNVHGQLYEFDEHETRGPPERLPYHYVPREFLLGKALAVFWPLPPFAPTWRLRLVR